MENLVCFFITLLKILFHYIFSTSKIFNHLFIEIEHTHISPISENEILPCASCQVFTGLFPSTSMSAFDFLFLFLPCLNLCVCVFKYSFIWLHQVYHCILKIVLKPFIWFGGHYMVKLYCGFAGILSLIEKTASGGKNHGKKSKWKL